MTTFVKICGMTDDLAIQAAVDAGADAVGFVFHERSPRNLPVDLALNLAALLPDSILKVAVTLHPDAALWALIQEVLQPDALQTDLGDFEYLDVAESIIKWPVVREGDVPETLPPQFVYEGQKSGQGQTVDWSEAAGLARSGRMMLAGGLSVENVADAIEIVRPYGVDVSSAVESSPGNKDPDKIRAFVAAARAA